MSGGSRTFRRAALERQSTPDRLDELLVVERPRDWIALAALAGILAAAVVWIVFGRVPIGFLFSGRQ
jgi:HlyD family secretion protein